MMTIDERIEKKSKDIEKRKNLILKLEKKIETITDEYDLKWAADDIRTSKIKLKDLEIQLTNLNKQKRKEQVKNEIERIPIIEEFLEQWKIKAIEWYKTDYNRLKEIIRIHRKKQKQLEQWRQENHISYYYNNPEVKAKVKAKEKELGLDQKIMQNTLTVKLLQFGKKWEQELEKEIEKDKNNKRQFLILRVKEITGQITDASFLHIGLNGEINGCIIGEKGKAKVETISAGGYNIQCYHYRVLVKEIV
jgi:hypothetical protein